MPGCSIGSYSGHRLRPPPDPGIPGPLDPDELVRIAAALEGHHVVQSAAQPEVVILLVEKDGHPVMDGPNRLVAVGHQAGIDGAPFRAVLPHSGPGEDRLAGDAEP